MKNYLLPLLFVFSIFASTCGIFEPEERVEYIYADTLYITDTLWVQDDGDDFEAVYSVWVEWDSTGGQVVKFYCKAIQRTDEKYGTNVIANGKLWTTEQDGMEEYYSLTSGRFHTDATDPTSPWTSFKERGTTGHAVWSSHPINLDYTYYWSIYLTY